MAQGGEPKKDPRIDLGDPGLVVAKKRFALFSFLLHPLFPFGYIRCLCKLRFSALKTVPELEYILPLTLLIMKRSAAILNT